jgi:hypothetical protein
MWPARNESAPTICVARATARWVASVASSLAIDASASDISRRRRLPRQHARGIELRRGIGQQSLDGLLAASTTVAMTARNRQRFVQGASPHAKARCGKQDARAGHEWLRRTGCCKRGALESHVTAHQPTQPGRRHGFLRHAAGIEPHCGGRQ